jgi:uncharacterized membrane protein YfcA
VEGDRLARLALIGAVAGGFSALFGVGGGIVMVPLLVVLLGYETKAATATSLAAIIIIASVGAVAHAGLDNIDWVKSVLIGVPAVGGLLVGLAIKARITSRALTLAFALLLVAVAVLLVVDP